MKDRLLSLVFPSAVLAAILGIFHLAEQGRQETISRVEAEVLRQGCTGADQSYNAPNIFYLRCPEGIREFDING